MLLINVDHHRRIIIGSQIMIIDHFKVHSQVANSMDQLSRLLTYPKLLGVEEGVPSSAYRVCNGINPYSFNMNNTNSFNITIVTKILLSIVKIIIIIIMRRSGGKYYHYHNNGSIIIIEVRWGVLSLS